MTATLPHLLPDRIGFTVAEVAHAAECSESYVRQRIADDTLAHLRIGDRAILLDGDWQTLHGTPPEGPATLARAFRGQDRVLLVDLARSLGVCPRTLKRLALAGDLPADRVGSGPWWVQRENAVRWLLQRRRPCRWEIAA